MAQLAKCLHAWQLPQRILGAHTAEAGQGCGEAKRQRRVRRQLHAAVTPTGTPVLCMYVHFYAIGRIRMDTDDSGVTWDPKTILQGIQR
jgi:hypothetical protein